MANHDMTHLAHDVELVVSELATNAMLHAQTVFTVALLASAGSLRLEVSDGSQEGVELVVARRLDTSGRGVAIVNILSRNWGVSHHAAGGKSVWAEFDPQG